MIQKKNVFLYNFFKNLKILDEENEQDLDNNMPKFDRLKPKIKKTIEKEAIMLSMCVLKEDDKQKKMGGNKIKRGSLSIFLYFFKNLKILVQENIQNHNINNFRRASLNINMNNKNNDGQRNEPNKKKLSYYENQEERLKVMLYSKVQDDTCTFF